MQGTRIYTEKKKKEYTQDFSGGPVVKNPPASAQDEPRMNPHAAGQLRLCPQILKPTCPRAGVLEQEKPLQ